MLELVDLLGQEGPQRVVEGRALVELALLRRGLEETGPSRPARLVRGAAQLGGLVALTGLLVLCVLNLATNTQDAFIYFRF